MDRTTSSHILKKLEKHYGTVKADLDFRNLYELAVAVVLSAQTTDKQVNAASPVLFSKYPDFDSLAHAGTKDVQTLIKSTGFYRNKASNIINLARKVTEEYQGRLPESREELEKLPGVGRKSANVILSIGFGKPALAVDTHVMRIANRLGYIESKNPLDVEKALTENIPEKKWTSTHLLFIRHGRAICRARNPLCTSCPIEGLCQSRDKTS